MRRLGPPFLLALAACGARPAVDQRTDVARVEEAVGTVLDIVLKSREGEYEDEALASYVAEVGARVAAHADRKGRWTFHVLDETDVNAYAIPGGHAYVTRGSLAAFDSEAELAAVLAHEIAHVTARHGLHKLSDFAAGGALADDPDDDASARDREYQADQLGVRWLAAAGYDPGAFLTMLRTIYAWPPDGTKGTPLAVRLARAALVIGERRGGEVARERYLQHLDGLVFGADPRTGRVEGRRLVSERSGFSLTFPAGLEAAGGSLGAADAAGTRALVFVPFQSVSLFDVLLADLLKCNKCGPVERRRLLGGVAALGQREGTWQAMVTLGKRRHTLVAKAPDLASARRLLDEALATYREVAAEERRSPQRIRIDVASRSAPLGELLQMGCAQGDPALALRLNGGAAGRVLAAGERFKCAAR